MALLGFPLIHNLSIQRQGVCELLDRIAQIELCSEEGRVLLASLQVRALFHLRVEDDLLVAILDAEAEEKPGIAAIMQQWVHPIRNCAEHAQAFFHHWLSLEGPIEAIDLQREWEALKRLLERRIEHSERLLYPAFKALSGERRRKSRAVIP